MRCATIPIAALACLAAALAGSAHGNAVLPFMCLGACEESAAAATAQIALYGKLNAQNSGTVTGVIFKWFELGTGGSLFAPVTMYGDVYGQIAAAGLVPIPMLSFNKSSSLMNAQQMNALTANPSQFVNAVAAAVAKMGAAELQTDFELKPEVVMQLDAPAYYRFLAALGDALGQVNCTLTVCVGPLDGTNPLFNATALAAISTVDAIVTMQTYTDKVKYDVSALTATLALFPRRVVVGMMPVPASSTARKNDYTPALVQMYLRDIAALGLCDVALWVWLWDVDAFWWTALQQFRASCVPAPRKRNV